MKFKIWILIALLPFSLIGQADKDPLSNCIDKLGWDSFKINVFPVSFKLSLDDNAQKIITIKHRNKCQILMRSVDADKAVVIHIVLTKILEPEKYYIQDSLIYHKDSNGKLNSQKIDSVKYTLNGVSWNIKFNNNIFNII